jgi:lysophospholipase L1-like esterase
MDATDRTRTRIEENGSRSGLPRLFLALGAALAVWGLPYLSTRLEGFRPWTREDPLPFSRLLDPGSSGPSVAEAAGGLEADRRLRPAERAILSGFDDAADGRGEPPRKQVLLAEAGPTKLAPPAEVAVPIEDPHGAMAAFYRALARTARARAGSGAPASRPASDDLVTRIAHFGDSAIAPDGLTSVARELLQRQFGDAGHGFILAAPATRWYIHRGVVLRSEGWEKRTVTRKNAPDGRTGYGGVRAEGSSRSFAVVGTTRSGPIGRAVSRFDLLFRRGPGEGQLLLQVDRETPRKVSAASRVWEDALHTVRVPDGPHQLRIRVEGSASVYGVALERDGPGVVYDTLGMVGLFADRLADLRLDHLRTQLAQRRPDLMILMLGGNTLAFPHWSAAGYRSVFDRMLKLFRRARPEASCLVMSPLDHGERHRGEIRTRPRLKEMVAIERAVGLANGCAFYSIFDAMGGEGTMARWSRSNPRLVSGDLAHTSTGGDRILGTLLYRALLAGYARSPAKGRPGHGPEHALRGR